MGTNEDPHPDLELACTVEGIVAGKDAANNLFQQGSIEDSVKWFSKCIWLAGSGMVPEMSTVLHSVLYSNRALVRASLQMWSESERDAESALVINPDNLKALYRCALARLELGEAASALAVIDRLLSVTNLGDETIHQASELKARILPFLPTLVFTCRHTFDAGGPSGSVICTTLAGRELSFIVPPGQEPLGEWVPASILKGNMDMPIGSRVCLTDGAAKIYWMAHSMRRSFCNVPATPMAQFHVLSKDAVHEADAAPTCLEVQDEVAVALVVKAELYPDIVIEFSLLGIEIAKENAISIFGAGRFEESSRWLSKCIWMIEVGLIDAFPDTVALLWKLYANRAFACLKLQAWQDAETDATTSLAINPQNAKATYRRALARVELKKYSLAMRDIDDTTAILGSPTQDLQDLRTAVDTKLRESFPTTHEAGESHQKK